MNPTAVQAAALAARGFYVFPIRAGSKKPLLKGWQAAATREAGVIAEMFHEGDNIGIYTGRYGEGQALLVVDVDRKDGQCGHETILNLELQGHVLPDTLTTVTPTDGRHLFYVVATPVRQGVHVLGPSVDVRSAGGYVVAAGSRLDPAGQVAAAGVYAFAQPEHPLAPAPQWLIDRCGSPRERSTAPATPLTGYAAEVAYARAREYLTNDAPQAVEGDGGDFATFKIAARVRDFGVSEREALALMLDWNENQSPPWSPEELETKVRNAYAYASGAFGGDNPAVVFEPVAETSPEPGTAGCRYRLEPVATVVSREPPRWLLRSILPERGMAVIYGPPGCGKTFAVLDMAASIARGEPWAGQRTRKGRVVYVGLEGHLGNRLRAYVQANAIPPEALDGLTIVERQPVDLLSDRDAVYLVRDIRAAMCTGRDTGVSLIVLDTLNRSMPGGDENSSEDMGKAIFAADYISRELDCLVLFVHHSGKSAGAGARGHSSLLGATDAELSVYRNDAGDRFIETTKLKDGDDGVCFAFKLAVVDLGQDPDPEASEGERITSCVVEGLRKIEKVAATAKVKLGVHAGNALTAFREVLRLYLDDEQRPFDEESILQTQWQAQFMSMYPDDPNARKRFYEARAELLRKAIVENKSEGRVALTAGGKLQ